MHHVYGWKPHQPDGEDDAHWSSNGQTITFPLEPEISSTTSSPPSHTDKDLPNCRPRKGDPDYVPRPQNAFFVFHREWVRKNARGPTRGKHSSSTDKRLSRRAGDAWKALSQRERDDFKERAEVEKSEHARIHPGYRYRPVRKNKKHKPVSPMTKSPALSHLAVSDSPSATGSEEMLRAFQSRFSVVPEDVPVYVSAAPSSFSTEQEEMLEVFGSRPQTAGHQSSEHDYPASPEFYIGYNPLSPPFTSSSEHVFSTNSSSLAGWNGELVAPPMSRVPSSYPMSTTSTLSSWNSFPQSYAQLENYRHQQFLFSDEPQSEQFHAGHTVDSVNYITKRNYPCQEFMEASALSHWNFGLENTFPGEHIPFDMPTADEKRVYEEYTHEYTHEHPE